MRKLTLTAILVFVLLACSTTDISQLIPLPGTTPQSDTATPFPTLTNTPQVPPTYTFTPTLIGQKPSPTVTNTPAVTPTLEGTTTPVNTVPGPALSPTLMPEDTGFDTVILSGDQLYVGTCGAGQVDFEVQVSRPDRISGVVMFRKFRNQVTGAETGWDRGTSLDPQGSGLYTLTLKAIDLPVQENPTWIVFQVVGTDNGGENKARSPVYADRLTFYKCP